MRRSPAPLSPLPPTTAQAAPTLLTNSAPQQDPSILTGPTGLARSPRPPQRTLIGGSV